MFGHRYFAAHQFAPRYYPPKTGAAPTPTPTGTTSYGYFPHKYFAARDFANRFYPGAGFGTVSPTPTPTPSPAPSPIEYLGGGGSGRRHHYSYIPAWQRLKREEEKISHEIAKLEVRIEQLPDNSVRQAQVLTDEINRLSAEKAALIRQIDEEEIALVLSMTPFI